MAYKQPLMRHFITVLTAILITTTITFAQDGDDNKTPEAPPENTSTSRDRIVLNWHFNNLAHDLSNDTLDVKWFSTGFEFYFMYDIQLGKSKMSVAPGIGVSINNFRNGSAIVETDSTPSFFVPLPNGAIKRNKNKLTVGYFDIPVELRFRATPNKRGKSFKWALGIKGGVLIDSHTKRVFEDSEGNKKKEKLKNFSDLARFRVAPTARIGFGAWNIYGSYTLTGFFKDGDGPDMNMWTIGLSINGL